MIRTHIQNFAKEIIQIWEAKLHAANQRIAELETLLNNLKNSVPEQTFNKEPNIAFVNILDGDQSYAKMPCFDCLQKRENPNSANLYIGDMKGFQFWANKHFDKKSDIEITPSKDQTKEWRQENISKSAGQKDNKCEKTQKYLLEQITGQKCLSSDGTRINHYSLEMKKYKNCMTINGICNPEGFDWSEDFDGVQIINGITVYYNFKMVCSSGGSQTRTLRDETYNFVYTQIKYLKQL